MFILLGEANLWTFEDVITIKDTDFGAFRYHEKRKDGLYAEGKRSYGQKRGMVCVPQNKKGNKLKDSIRYLEEQLRDNSVVYFQWYDHCTMRVVLSSGLLIQIQVDLLTGDIRKITFDKYLVGKVSDHISDVIITKSHLVCTYNDNQVTLVHFTKPRRHIFEKISRLEPRLLSVDLTGPNGRRLDKKIEINKTGDLILIWWKSTMNEVYPWSPAVKEYDRANVHLYRLTGTKVELLCYLRTEFDPLCVTFNKHHENVIHSVEQKVSRKGEVTIEWRTYEVSQQDKLQRIAVTSVPLPTHTSCVRFSPNHDMLLLCCIDGSITLHDQARGTNNSIKASFIPTLASWHCNGIVFAVGNERGQFQHFDISLSCIRSQLLSEDTTPANILDLSSYFSRSQPALLRMEWNKKIDPNSYTDYYDHGDSLFLLLFERGPLGVIKFVEGGDLSGDALVRRHLGLAQVERATSLLLSMNWDTHTQACMHSLNQILNHLFKLPLTPERESLIQNALGSFHVPIRPISQAVEDEYGDEVRDLTRRFFHHLLRYRLFEKAFRLAIDLNDHDLFMDIHFYALVTDDVEMATAAKEKAEHILSRSNSCSTSHSTCSRPSCSICSGSESGEASESYSGESESEDSPARQKVNFNHPSKRSASKSHNSHVPPLPILHPHLYKSNSLMSTSFSDASNSIMSTVSSKVDSNLMSTAFNTPSSDAVDTTFNESPKKPLTSPPFINPTLLTTSYTPADLMFTSVKSSSSSDMMSTSFSDLNPTAFNHSSNNLVQKSFNHTAANVTPSSLSDLSSSTISSSFQHSKNFMPSVFNNGTYAATLSDKAATNANPNSNMMSTSFSNASANLMPASFNNLLSNLTSLGISEASVASISRNTKLSPNDSPSNSTSTSFNNGSTTNKASTVSFNNTVSNVGSMPFYNTGSNVMSTSFINPENVSLNNPISSSASTSFNNLANSPTPQNISKIHHSTSTKKHVSINLPPPPSIINSYNYVHNLPSKNYPLSQSTPGLTEVDEPAARFQPTRQLNAISKILQRQNSVSSILQNQHRNSNYQSARTYRLNYDLDYVPFHGSCDNLSMEHSNMNEMKAGSVSSINHLMSNYNNQSKAAEARYPKPSFLQTGANSEQKLSSNVPPLPVIHSPLSIPKTSSHMTTPSDAPASNEKPKVKFSDTVTHILVPGTGQPYRPIQKRTVTKLHPMDPKRELAESLPLCLGNEDYLKDFQPLSKDMDGEKAKESPKAPEETAKIKVVHFGLL